jgi:hypothetical protein
MRSSLVRLAFSMTVTLAMGVAPVLARADGDANYVLGLDTAVKLNDDLIQKLAQPTINLWVFQATGVSHDTPLSFVGAYLAHLGQTKNVTPENVRTLAQQGIAMISIWEYQGCPDYGANSYTQGQKSGAEAWLFAQALGQPTDTPIYFSAEDCREKFGTDNDANVIQYLKGVQASFDALSQHNSDLEYAIGVYGEPETLSWVQAQDSAVSYFFQGTDTCSTRGSFKWPTGDVQVTLAQIHGNNCNAPNSEILRSGKDPMGDLMPLDGKNTLDVDFDVARSLDEAGAWTTTGPNASCGSDTDCMKGQVCAMAFGICEQQPLCSSDDDCGDGKTCDAVLGTCRAGTASANDASADGNDASGNGNDGSANDNDASANDYDAAGSDNDAGVRDDDDDDDDDDNGNVNDAGANDDTSGDDTSGDDTSNDDTSNDDTSNDDTSNDDTSNDDTSNDDTSNDDTSNDDNSGDDSSDDDSTGDDSSDDDSSGDDSSGDDNQ